MEKKVFVYDKPFTVEGGQVLPRLEVGYVCSKGGYHGQKVIWLCHAVTASADPRDWWAQITGPGLMFDTEKYFVICANSLGSCFGSSGPASINPLTGKPYYFDFPKVTVRDSINAFYLLCQHLGISKIDLLVGASMGGFHAQEFAIMHPELIKRAVFMATTSRVTPWLTAFEETQRMALEADPTFRMKRDLKGGLAGLKCARGIAIMSYRCEEGYNIKQWEDTEDVVFADKAASYQRYQGSKFVRDFDAYSYWYLTYVVDSINVGRDRGGVEKALKMIQCPATVISLSTDLLFPPVDMEPMARMMGADFHVIQTHFGHDGFLIEFPQMEVIIAPIVKEACE